jgi:hypothetical protein
LFVILHTSSVKQLHFSVIFYTPRGKQLHLSVIVYPPGEYNVICLLFSMHPG